MPCAGDDRLEARLQALPHAALVEALAACMTDGRPAAEACVAKHLPFPERACKSVSPLEIHGAVTTNAKTAQNV